MLFTSCLILSGSLITFAVSQNIKRPRTATAWLQGPQQANGWAKLSQDTPKSSVIIQGEIFNLPLGIHEINVHENGDVTNYCANVGPHFNPTRQKHGNFTDPQQYAGDLGTLQVKSENDYELNFRIVTHSLSLYKKSSWNIINRSLVISMTLRPELEPNEIPLACGIISKDKKTISVNKAVNVQEDLSLKSIFSPQVTSERQTWVSFLLRTKEFCFKDTVLNAYDETTIMNSYFNASRPTKFIVHGYLNSGLDTWVTRMSNALLYAGDFNVIVVNWMKGATGIYFEAVDNVAVVGSQTAFLIQKLMEYKGLDPEDVHIIGHSLGAQIAGATGSRISSLGRITGLDPAGPLFRNVAKNLRLDEGDALFVEALHTNAVALEWLGFGTEELVGHIDFFANGGKHQPGCELRSLPNIIFGDNYWNSGNIFACNHNRAIDLYTDAIVSQHIAFECENYDTFLKGACNSCKSANSSCRAEFGLNANPEALGNRQNVPMYFQTSAFSPYTLNHYRLMIETYPKEMIGEKAMINITVVGEKSRISQSITKELLYNIGNIYTFLLTSSIDIGNIKEVNLYYEVTCSWLCFGKPKPIYLKSIQVGQMTLADPDARNAEKLYPCPPSLGDTMDAGEDVLKKPYKIASKGMKKFVPVFQEKLCETKPKI